MGNASGLSKQRDQRDQHDRHDPIVEIIDVSKTIKRTVIVEEVSLRVQPGEVLALCGVNGAGKSTLLRMLVGIMQPTAGVIRVNGLDWRSNRRTYADQIGYMPDDYRFGNNLTARETLAFWASLRGLSNDRVDELLVDVGLAETGKKSVSSFSKGMRQRVLFAQALLAKPPLLVLDEPTNGLDPYWMESFVSLIRKVRAGGQTVIFSTHQLQMAEALADRIVLMNQGRVQLDDRADSIGGGLGGRGLQDAFAGMFGLADRR